MIWIRIEQWRDIGYAARFKSYNGEPVAETLAIEWELFEIRHHDLVDESVAGLAFLAAECPAMGRSEDVKSMDDAQVFAKGSVKWDHCINFSFPERWSAIHGCSRGDLENIGEVLGRVHDVAIAMMPRAD